MKVLLDEGVAHKLRASLLPHDVRTTRYMGWDGLTNGTLPRAAEESGFEVFVTCDKGLPDQQDIRAKALGVVVLSAQNWDIISAHVETIRKAIEDAVPGSLQYVECGEFRR